MPWFEGLIAAQALPRIIWIWHAVLIIPNGGEGGLNCVFFRIQDKETRAKYQSKRRKRANKSSDDSDRQKQEMKERDESGDNSVRQERETRV